MRRGGVPSTIFRMPLTKAERSALMTRFLEGGLKASDLNLREDRWEIAKMADRFHYRVKHEPTGSAFSFIGPVSNSWSQFTWVGGDGSPAERVEDARDRSGGQLLEAAEDWARAVARWAATPDLWGLDTEPLPEAADNSPFTQAEQAEIAKRLDEARDFAREQFELPDDEIAAIGQAVEELKEASERVGRKDWKLMLYGAFVSLGLEHAVSSGVVETLFRLAVQGLAHLFGAGPPMITA
jgi:hypothetical protein